MLCFFIFLWSKLIFLTIAQNDWIDLESLSANEIAIMQYDSREPEDYWLSAAEWNNHYCKQHGHKFIFYSSKEGCHHGTEKLATPWCKVKAMISANEDYPEVKLFIYMDSDAVINKRFQNNSINSFLKIMQSKLSWDVSNKPIVFNQDGSCEWCSLVVRVGYSVCLNAGTVVWYRHARSEMVLRNWWDASMDPYEGNPVKRSGRYNCLM